MGLIGKLKCIQPSHQELIILHYNKLKDEVKHYILKLTYSFCLEYERTATALKRLHY
jgi:hypothetical protein